MNIERLLQPADLGRWTVRAGLAMAYVATASPGHALVLAPFLDEYLYSGEATRSTQSTVLLDLISRLAKAFVGATLLASFGSTVAAWMRSVPAGRGQTASRTTKSRPESCISYSKVPAAGFEPAHFGLKELARLSVWPELGYPARSEQKLICI
jgi:hypothetical protein